MELKLCGKDKKIMIPVNNKNNKRKRNQNNKNKKLNKNSLKKSNKSLKKSNQFVNMMM